MNLKESVLPDLSIVSKAVRKRRAPKHDFKDGAGRVFAHKHDNGGGWVADTARVAESVKVTRNAQVAQFARIEDECSVEGRGLVTGHARLSGHVRVIQEARVGGSARVCDRVTLAGHARVEENALVGGSSTLENNTLVNGWSQIFNTRVHGPRGKNHWATVSGSARVMDSNLWGLSLIGQNAILHRGTFNNARAHGGARIMDSNLTTVLPSHIAAALSLGHDIPGGGDILEQLAIFEGNLIRSQVNVPRCRITDTVYFIGCRIMLHSVPFQELSNEVYFDFNTNDPAEVVSYSVTRGRNPAGGPNLPQQRGSGIPAVASVGVVHNPETIRQRRIMRLERSEE